MANARLTSLLDIEDLALESGSTIEYADGRKFNTGGAQAVRRPRSVEAAPAPAPAPPAPAPNDALVKQLLGLLNRPVQVNIPELPTPNIVVNAPTAPAVQPPAKWVFEFERNPNGTIRTVTATAQKE